MTMKNLVSISALLASLALLAGCPAKKPEVPPPPPSSPPPTPAASKTRTPRWVTPTHRGTVAASCCRSASSISISTAPTSAPIRRPSWPRTRSTSRKNPAQKVRLEGHADERGSREYNIGLGERRGQAVRRALALQGVAETQLSTVSYGEERPAAAGSDEQAYGLNRRVEIVYLK